MHLLSQDQEAIQGVAAEFCRHHIHEEVVREHDEMERYPTELLKLLAAVGGQGVLFPEKYDGLGYAEIGVLLEALGYHMLALATAYIQNVIFAGVTILEFGTAEQQQKFLPDMIAAHQFFCLAATEPDAGSDLASLQTRATRHGDHYLLSGSKMFSTGAHVADHLLVAARTASGETRQNGISLFLVERAAPGVVVQPLSKLGMRAVGTNAVFFDDVQVPVENLLGEKESRGWQQLLWLFERERAMVACACVGGAQAATDMALAYAKERLSVISWATECGRMK